MAAPLFRRGDVICEKYYALTKSGEAALWVGFWRVRSKRSKAAEEQGEGTRAGPAAQNGATRAGRDIRRGGQTAASPSAV